MFGCIIILNNLLSHNSIPKHRFPTLKYFLTLMSMNTGIFKSITYL